MIEEAGFIHQIELETGFLHGEIGKNEILYIRVPSGTDLRPKTGEALRLKKSIYGLKTSPRACNRK